MRHDIFIDEIRVAHLVDKKDSDIIVNGLKNGTFWVYRGDTTKYQNVTKKRCKQPYKL